MYKIIISNTPFYLQHSFVISMRNLQRVMSRCKAVLSLLSLVVITYSSSALALDRLTGAWYGTIAGKSIELALWPSRRDTGSTWSEWNGYFLSTHYDCFMVGLVAYNADKTAISFTSHGIVGRKNNCKKNITSRSAQFRLRVFLNLKDYPVS